MFVLVLDKGIFESLDDGLVLNLQTAEFCKIIVLFTTYSINCIFQLSLSFSLQCNLVLVLADRCTTNFDLAFTLVQEIDVILVVFLELPHPHTCRLLLSQQNLLQLQLGLTTCIGLVNLQGFIL